ncbi:MAG TPA: hypothetical protein VM779_07090 [Thermoanaerobaculia bacterium]|nr:hypothetical protein [Thermoanaerobaculia bacterium]
MRKPLLIGVVTVVALWVAVWVASLLVRSSLGSGDRHEWPDDLGSLSEIPARYPPVSMSRAAARLVALAEPLGIDMAPRDPRTPPESRPLEFVRGQIGKWLAEQLSNPTPRVEPLPSESGEYFAGRAADLAAIVTLLLSDEPIVWPEDLRDPVSPLPNFTGHMNLHRVLVARALDRSRFGDSGGWNDLRAAWHVARPLLDRHESISKMIALAIARNVNAAARKMPLPAPDWLAGMQELDFRGAFLAGAQADAWAITDRVYEETTIDGAPLARRAVDTIMAPYTRLSAADWAEASRRIAQEIAATTDCALDMGWMAARLNDELAWWNALARRLPTPNLEVLWQRVLRFTPEREATVRALALRTGSPPLPASRCAGATWIYAADGRSFRFSKEIPVPGPNQIPLEFVIPSGSEDDRATARPDSSLRSE